MWEHNIPRISYYARTHEHTLACTHTHVPMHAHTHTWLKSWNYQCELKPYHFKVIILLCSCVIYIVGPRQ